MSRVATLAFLADRDISSQADLSHDELPKLLEEFAAKEVEDAVRAERVAIAYRLEEICNDYGKTMPDFIDELRNKRG